jgi:hypothetical protein
MRGVTGVAGVRGLGIQHTLAAGADCPLTPRD